MDWRTVTFDWNRARAFLVTAEEGSLSAAARALGMTQPTLGRQVNGLEEELGVVLFERTGRGLRLTETGLDLLEHMRSMGEAANRVSLMASGRATALEGPIRITATEPASAYYLPGIITRLRKDYPGISVEIVATNEVRDLRRREADIAIRGALPTDPDLFASRIGTGTAALFAARSYLDAHGPFPDEASLSTADFIGFEPNEGFIMGLKKRGLTLTRANFPVTCANQLVQWQIVRAGAGIGVMENGLAATDPDVAPAAPWLKPFRYDLWLVAHRELKTSRRVRVVFDRLAAEIGQILRDQR